jgi:hypothetical protein
VVGLPAFPNPRHRERAIVLERDPVRLLGLVTLHPLVEAVCGDQTATAFVRVSETGLLVDRLRAGVDAVVTGAFVVGPRGD